MNGPLWIDPCTEDDIRESDILLPDPDKPQSPHQDCGHVEFDLLEMCRMCRRHRSMCEGTEW